MEFHNARYKKTLHENSKRSRNFKHAVLSYSLTRVCVSRSCPPSLQRFMLSLVAKVIVPVGLCTFLPPPGDVHIRKHSMKRACNSLPIASDAEIIFVSPFGLHLCKPFTWTLCPGPATVWIIQGHSRTVPPRCFCSARGGRISYFLRTARYLHSRRRLAESKSDRKLWLQSTSEGNGQIYRAFREPLERISVRYGKNLPEYGAKVPTYTDNKSNVYLETWAWNRQRR